MKNDITFIVKEEQDDMKMNKAVEMTEERAFKENVKTMSQDELMDAIRYLDAERKRIAENVHRNAKLDIEEKKGLKRSA